MFRQGARAVVFVRTRYKSLDGVKDVRAIEAIEKRVRRLKHDGTRRTNVLQRTRYSRRS